jgi:hydroxylamine dehydrogenase
MLLIALGLWLVPAAVAATYTPAECVTCHTTLNPGIVTQYQQGAMSGAGVTCVSCHGDDHVVIDATQGQVPASACAQVGCHPQQYGEFAAKDASGAYVNKHAQGWTRMVAAARYRVMPEAQRYEMCERCHNIGYVSADGSVGKCDSCHTRHTFSAEEAMEPEACGTCHMGPDHEQIDMWEKSKHGVVYTTEKSRSGGDPSRAPTCVTCHMPEMDNGVGQALTHDVSTNLTLGTVAQGAQLAGVAQPVPMRTISAYDFGVRRDRMSRVCEQCHAQPFVDRNLTAADTIKSDVDALLWDPVMRIRGLWYDGLLDPMPENRPANPVLGQSLALGGQQLYGGTSAIEQLFFYTYKYDHVSTFKGAYHINPDYSHWYGWSRVNQDRDLIKGEEAKLRRLAEPYDAGFAVTTARPTAGAPVTLDASALVAWGDAAANTFEWWTGDGGHSMPAASPSLSYVYAKAGTYTVELTCSDGDLVNNAAAPTTCSGKRTTSLKVTVKDAATLTLAAPARVKAGKKVKLNGALTTGSAGDREVKLQIKTSNGGWKTVGTRTVTAAAGTATPVSFKYKLTRTTTFRLSYAGSATAWDAVSMTRKVKPR